MAYLKEKYFTPTTFFISLIFISLLHNAFYIKYIYYYIPLKKDHLKLNDCIYI